MNNNFTEFMKCESGQFSKMVNLIKNDRQFIYLVDFTWKSHKDFCLIFMNPETSQKIILEGSLPFDDICSELTVLDWPLREKGSSDFLNRHHLFPLLEKRDRSEYTFPVLTHVKKPEDQKSIIYDWGSSEFLKESFPGWLEFTGKEISRARFYLGTRHQQFEKLFCSDSFESLTRKSAKLSEQSPIAIQCLFSEFFEKLTNIEVPGKAQGMRMLFLELDRIFHHLGGFYELFSHLEIDLFIHRILPMRDFIKKLFYEYNGQAYGQNLVVSGGVCRDIPEGWVIDTSRCLREILEGIEKIELDLFRNSHFLSRLRTHQISTESALNYSLSGPLLRSCGIKFDFRKTSPKYFYHEVDFEVPLGVSGDAYDGFLVRLTEIKQSIHICLQVIEGIPIGAFRSEDWKNSTNIPTLETSSYEMLSEGPEGLLGLTAFFDEETKKMNRFKIRSPHFYHLQYLEQFVLGMNLDEARLAKLSFHIDLLEAER